jgi:hypothetical protein
MDGDPVPVRALVEELRQRARDVVLGRRRPGERLEPLEPLASHPSLAYLHRHWALKRTLDTAAVPVPRRDPKGAARVLGRRALVALLGRYLDEEQELLANVVRVEDALAKAVDELAERQRWLLDALEADLRDLASALAELLERLGTEAPPPAPGGAGQLDADRG